MPKKQDKLGKMTQTHGQEETFKPTTLNQIWGDDGLSKYGTMEAAVYQKQLDDMHKSDLQAHATKVGLVPVDDRVRLIKRLMHEFNLHVAAFRHPSNTRPAPQKISPEVAKILAEGR